MLDLSNEWLKLAPKETRPKSGQIIILVGMHAEGP